MKALKEHPEGVPTNYFTEEYKGITLSDPKAVGEKMKLRNSILYRIELERYELQTTAIKQPSSLTLLELNTGNYINIYHNVYIFMLFLLLSTK